MDRYSPSFEVLSRPMNETYLVELTNEQRELLLQGLRFVQSNIRLDMRIPTPESDRQRAQNLREVAELIAQLDSAPLAGSAAGV